MTTDPRWIDETEALAIANHLRKAVRERDSLARRCAVRYEEKCHAEAERDALAARLERAERVVEAAMAWLAQRRSPDAFLREPRAELIRLADALDAYRAAPSTPTPALDPEVAAVVDATVRDWEQHRDEAREGSDG